MNAYQYIKESIRKGIKEKLVAWRKDKTIVRIDKPTDIGRARNLGYKDKRGFVVVRVRVKRGGHKKPRPNKGRRSKRLHTRKNLKMSYKWIAEQRVERKYKNLTVLNSYLIGKDGQYYFYEVICVDPSRPEIKNDKTTNWVTKGENKKRALRGLTSAGKKSRGLRNKNPTNKSRPSVRAGGRKGK